MNETKHSFVLASASPRRIELLKNIKIFPKITYPSEINEDIIHTTTTTNPTTVAQTQRISWPYHKAISTRKQP